ncbi:uncharacterized protein STEHIDRAFT_135598 [Stereum hirsutum FP-91666 SS1]|uniref:Uncharacterized protein n=1 Tax=Stereum hirsutum (strain FP-91666) TaxID=721885 RepID=R7RWN5_STEHR|nr:uncharacterized protein STEHIDRAFT_135598 [Stereum hirsutum FP-91666 SS1]EIM79786.1 hypothetical protein STEHIDRAFT_135598 [Stereum hirsutum FP-91666 SS1]
MSSDAVGLNRYHKHPQCKTTPEQPVPLPSAPLQIISESPSIVLQPPLTRRGTGPGLIVTLPPSLSLQPNPKGKPLDPEPVQKWAEEGFAVVGITATETELEAAVVKALDSLEGLEEVGIKDKVAVLGTSIERHFSAISSIVSENPKLVCIAAYISLGSNLSTVSTSFPTLFHISSPDAEAPPSDAISAKADTTSQTATYPSTSSPFFVLPNSSSYDPGNASLAHTTALVFFRKHLGGPNFDIAAIWEEHIPTSSLPRGLWRELWGQWWYAEPYVNHVPTMTGGIGRKALSAFYRDHFIFANPADTSMQTVSRTVGPDRVVDEFILRMTHDRTVDWLLPKVPPTGKKIAVPMLGVINVRGDRLYHGPTPQGKRLKLPISEGNSSARLLIDETDGVSNEMFGEDWGVTDA